MTRLTPSPSNRTKPEIIKTEEAWRRALERIETLMDAAAGSAKEEELELWSLLVENYEAEHFPIDLPDPAEANKISHGARGIAAEGSGEVFPGQEPGIGNPQSQTPAQPRHDPLFA